MSGNLFVTPVLNFRMRNQENTDSIVTVFNKIPDLLGDCVSVTQLHLAHRYKFLLESFVNSMHITKALLDGHCLFSYVRIIREGVIKI